MSFDIFLSRFQQGEVAEAPRDAIAAVLRQRQYVGPDQSGFYSVRLPDGHTVDFSARALQSPGRFDSCAFFLHGLSRDVAQLVYDVARAGRFAVLPAMEDSAVLLVEEDMADDLPPDMLQDLRPVYVADAAALFQVLSGGFAGWADCRNHVVDEVPGSGGRAGGAEQADAADEAQGGTRMAS